jgi:dimethylaniline monooxygenase (N-oxide forming)
MNSFILKLRNETYDLRPEWGFDPAPQVNQSRPIVSDDLVENLASGNVKSCVDVKGVVDDRLIELIDGTKLEVDAIIYCTGYRVDYSIVGDADPSRALGDAYQGKDVVVGENSPRLYQNIFSLEHPDSLAFMGNLSFMNPAFLMFDLATMALAQVWKGKTKLPPREELNRAVHEHHKWIRHLKAKGPVVPGLVNAVQWMDWVEEATGLGLKQYLGYGLKGWYFWLTDRKFCNVLMDGLMTPIHYRVFPGSKRKHWDGSRDAIMNMHEDLTSRKW